MPEPRRPEPHKKKPFEHMPDMVRLREKLGEAWIARIEKEIKDHEPNISPEMLRIKRYEILKLMAEEIKKNREE